MQEKVYSRVQAEGQPEEPRKDHSRAGVLNCCCCCCSGFGCCILIALFFYNSVLASALAASMSLVTGSKVEVSAAHVGIMVAEADIQGLTVENPNGMKGTFMDLEECLFDMDIWSLIHEPIHVQSMIVNELNINILQPIGQKSNIQIILENLQKHIPQEHAAETQSAKTKFSFFHDAMHKKIIVGELNLTNIHVSVYAPIAAPEEKPVSFNLSDIRLKNMGTARHAIPAYQLLEVIVKNIMIGTLKNNVAKQLLMNSLTELQHLVHVSESSILQVAKNATAVGNKAAASVLRGAANATEKLEAEFADILDGTANATEVRGSVAENLAQGVASVLGDAAKSATIGENVTAKVASVLDDAASVGEHVTADVAHVAAHASKAGGKVAASLLSGAAITRKRQEKAAASLLSDAANATRSGKELASKKLEDGVAALTNPGNVWHKA